MNNSKSYYDILNVSPQGSDEDIKRAFRRMALDFHPDCNPHNRAFYDQRFRQISEAYEGLRTKERRARYNRSIGLAGTNDNKATTSWLSHLTGALRTREQESL